MQDAWSRSLLPRNLWSCFILSSMSQEPEDGKAQRILGFRSQTSQQKRKRRGEKFPSRYVYVRYSCRPHSIRTLKMRVKYVQSAFGECLAEEEFWVTWIRVRAGPGSCLAIRKRPLPASRAWRWVRYSEVRLESTSCAIVSAWHFPSDCAAGIHAITWREGCRRYHGQKKYHGKSHQAYRE